MKTDPLFASEERSNEDQLFQLMVGDWKASRQAVTLGTDLKEKASPLSTKAKCAVGDASGRGACANA